MVDREEASLVKVCQLQKRVQNFGTLGHFTKLVKRCFHSSPSWLRQFDLPTGSTLPLRYVGL